MNTVKSGDKVRVNYTGKLSDGSVFDSTIDGEPFEFTLGSGDVIEGFENAVFGMTPGDSKVIVIPSDQAYGSYNHNLAVQINESDFPDGEPPELGQQLELAGEDGSSFVMTVIDIGDGKVTLDGNHPLAGQDLTFEINLLEIV